MNAETTERAVGQLLYKLEGAAIDTEVLHITGDTQYGHW